MFQQNLSVFNWGRQLANTGGLVWHWRNFQCWKSLLKHCVYMYAHAYLWLRRPVKEGNVTCGCVDLLVTLWSTLNLLTA